MKQHKRVEVLDDQELTSMVHVESQRLNKTLCGIELNSVLSRSTGEITTCMTCLVHEAKP